MNSEPFGGGPAVRVDGSKLTITEGGQVAVTRRVEIRLPDDDRSLTG